MNGQGSTQYPSLQIGKGTKHGGRVTLYVIKCDECDMDWREKEYPNRHSAMVALNEHREMHLKGAQS